MRFIAVFILSFSSNLFSQVLTYSVFTPAVGDPNFSTFQIDSTSLFNLPSGNNITWSITPTGFNSKQTYSISSYTLPLCNVKLKLTAGPTNIKEIGYTLNSNSTWDNIEAWRETYNIGIDYIDIKYANYYPNYITYLGPALYSTLSTSGGTITINNSSVNTYTISNFETIHHPDANGTLILPNISYTDIHRVSVTHTLIANSGKIKIKKQNYDYYSLSHPKYPILSIHSYSLISTTPGINSKQAIYATIHEDAMTVGIKENQILNKNIIVYPNPSNGILNLNLFNAIDSKYDIEVFDIYGKSVYKTEKLNRNSTEFIIEINLSDLNLPNGLYLININSNNQSSSQRIMIEK